MDGVLDERAWAQAAVFTSFRQTFPNASAPPSERTELKVLYDDTFVYFGILCHDSQPGLINRRLGRRDNPPASDMVTVMLDPLLERRTAYAFSINAGGVLQDGLYSQETQLSTDWDAVWEGSAAEHPSGWSAELRIPLSALRFSAADEQLWGLNVRRELARTGEIIDSSIIPRGANALVSRIGTLEGMKGLTPKRSMDLTPYVATQGVLRPQFSALSQPLPRLLEPSANVGLNVRASLTSDLMLTATLNPDFGQVEADERILNLTNFEKFFPEKRPFFTEGMELFLPVGAQGSQPRQMLFYSRRIGLDTPLLTAGKLTGTLAPGWELGVLDAVVAGAADPSKAAALGAGQPFDEAHPDRRFQFHLGRPLRFGLNSELPAVRPVTTNFLTAVLRHQVREGASVGTTLALLTPLEDRCLAGQEDTLTCRVAGSNALGVDWNLRTRDSTWGVVGQVAASRVAGGPANGRLLADGTALKPGDMGVGGHVRAGKLGGEPWRFAVGYEYATPQFDLNPTGYLETQNEHKVSAQFSFVRTSRMAFFEEFSATAAALARWTTDGRHIPRGHEVAFTVGGILSGLHELSCSVGSVFERGDVREISGTGIPFEWPAFAYAECTGETDPRQALSLSGTVFLDRSFPTGPIRPRNNLGGELSGSWRPHARLQTQLLVSSEGQVETPLYIGSPSEGTYLFGDLDSRFLSIILRQSLVLTPRLTLQAYAQFFSIYGRYGLFYEGFSDGTQAVRPADLRRTEAPEVNPSFQTSNINLNLVLRWEYQSGSTLFLVFTRAQDQFPFEGLPGRTLQPVRLLEGPANDVLLLKWTHRLEL
ncbi:DUF5916 domain-containing protein [Cystobacter fuscus]|uniref:DUF5916 domain-containing protein n=1 Tax=Cystobacter fuscus TaxID=43 RepID=UPI0012FE709D|nr:DUF5916 domain-containing protein [Cystobacter fuscus]